MSLPTRRQAYSFLTPLRGKTTTFLIDSRKNNVALSRFLLGCLAALKTRTTLFDTSSFYGVNIGEISRELPKEFLQRTTLVHPPETGGPEDSLSGIAAIESPAILIDDLNAILHLLSSQSRRSGIYRLGTLFRILSYEARVNGLLVLGVAYRSGPETSTTGSQRRSLPDIADLPVMVEVRPDEIVFRCDSIPDWPKEGFRSPFYLEPRT